MQHSVGPAETARKGDAGCVHTRQHELQVGQGVAYSHALGAATPAGDLQTLVLSMHRAVRLFASPIWAK